MALRRDLSGLPGVVVRARPSGGQRMRGMGGGGESRLSVEIRGHDLEESSRLARDVKAMMDITPGIADSQLQREDGRPELAVRVDRDKAALLGLTVTGVANTIRTNLAGTQAAMFRDAGNEYPIVVRLRESDRGRHQLDRQRAAQHAVRPGAAGEERHERRARPRAPCRSSGRTRSASSASTPRWKRRSAWRWTRCRSACRC
jgi:multidrug efflux pump subunit AcrB